MLLYLFSFLVSAGLFAFDQWSKNWVSTHMSLGETAPLLGNLLELNCVHNYGVAWSLFSGMRWILVAVTACIVIAVATALANGNLSGWLTGRLYRGPLKTVCV